MKIVSQLLTDDRLQAYARLISELNANFKPNPGQIEAGEWLFSKGARRIFIECGRKWGKTSWCVDTCWRLGNMIQNGQGYYFGALAKSVREFLWAPGRLQAHGPREYIAEIHKTEMRQTFTSGTFVKLDGADEFRASKGFNPDFCVLDEYADYPEEFWHAMSPNFASKDCIVIIISSPPWLLETEPGKPVQFVRLADVWQGYMDEAMRKGKQSRYVYMNQPSHVNECNLPKGWLAEEEKELAALGMKDVWEREYLAKRVVGGGRRLIGTFDREKHVFTYEEIQKKIERDKTVMEWVTSVDPSQSAFGALVMALNPYTKEVYFMDEVLEHDENATTEHALWPRLQAMEEEAFFEASSTQEDSFTRVCDEAAKWWIVGCANDRDIGVSFLSTEKFSNSIESGVSTLRTLFSTNRGYVSERCKNLIWQMENWRRDQRGVVPKANKDLIDCARYGMHVVNFALSKEDRPLWKTPHPRQLQHENYISLEKELSEVANVLFKDSLEVYSDPEMKIWQH